MRRKINFELRFKNCKTAKSIWNDFHYLGLIKRPEAFIDHSINLSELNKYFISGSGSFIDEIDYCYLDNCLIKCDSNFEFKVLDNHTVKKSILRLTSSSKGPDDFKIKTYK